MNTAETESSGDRDSRAQSAVLGLVLLIGVVAMASVGILLYAGQSTADVQQETENERIESAFVELSQTMGTTAATGDTIELVDFAAGEHGAVVKKDAGYIHIEGGDIDKNLSIGAIEYEGDDGTRIAYQAGGVFRETGNETRIISAPPVHYDRATETFSFPVTTVSGEAELDSGEITVRHNSTDPHRDATVVKDDSVDITIESPYYRGWEAYFERQAGGAAIRNVTHPETDGEPGTVEIVVGYTEIDEAFNDGIIVNDRDAYEDQGQVNISEDQQTIAPMPELDDMIEMMVEDAKNGHFNDSDIEASYGTFEGGTLEHGTESGAYFAEEVDLDEDLRVDLSSGNVTLIVEENVTLNQDQSVIVEPHGTDHEFSIWTLGHVDLNEDACVETCPEKNPDPDEIDSKHLQIYASSDSHVSFGTGQTTFEGALYAAGAEDDISENVVHSASSCSAQVCIHSNVNIYGAIVASSIYAQGGEGSIDFEYDPELSGIDIYPKGYRLPPQLTYLNLAHHEVDVEPR